MCYFSQYCTEGINEDKYGYIWDNWTISTTVDKCYIWTSLSFWYYLVYRISFLRCRGILSTRKQNTKCIGQVILENTPTMTVKCRTALIQGQSLTFFLQGAAGLPRFVSRGPAESLGPQPAEIFATRLDEPWTPLFCLGIPNLYK
jgi:hypothetical protein